MRKVTLEEITNLVRLVSRLREGIAFGEFEEGSSTLELSIRDMSVITYALVGTWLSEYLAGERGHRETMAELMRVAEEFLVVNEMPQIDKFIDDVLGKHNPEEAADGA